MFFQIYGETAGWQLLGWLMVFVGLVVMNEVARRSKAGGIACFLVLPAVLTVYFIAIYGTTPGAAGYMASKAIRGCKINAYYAVRMPDTWTPIFDLSTPEKIEKYTQTTESAIDSVIRCIKARHTNRHMSPRTPAWITQLIAQPLL